MAVLCIALQEKLDNTKVVSCELVLKEMLAAYWGLLTDSQFLGRGVGHNPPKYDDISLFTFK